MNDIIQKRTDLINFFLNQEEIYTKEDVLNKEFSVLSFSPSEEYIDTLHSQFDDLCIDLSTHKIEDTSEIYIKGIIVDVDRQNYQTIIHLQNKESLISVTCKDAVASKYDDYFVVGEPVIVKCKVFNERLYLSLLIQLNNINDFDKECRYIDGSAKKTIDTIMATRKGQRKHYGLIIECAMVKTSKGRDMLIGTLYDGEKNRSFGIVKTKYNPKLPKYAMAGDYVTFNRPTDEFFLNNMEVVNYENFKV